MRNGVCTEPVWKDYAYSSTRGLRGKFRDSRKCHHKKTEYYKQGSSEQHLRDITGILAISGKSINRDYVAKWARQMGLTEIWEAVQKRLKE